MNIGYSIEGSTDRAMLSGLQRRWCPGARLIPGRFRGTSRLSARREIPNICIELRAKDADVIIFLRDANEEDWRDVLKADKARCRPEHQHLTVFGVCARNTESWLCCDASWVAAQTGRKPDDFRVQNPKGIFESAFGIIGTEKKEGEITSLVERAPLKNWLANASFQDFYGKLWIKSKQFPSCRIENLHESQP